MKAVLRALRTPGALVPIALWAALWLNLNTGPWLLDRTSGMAHAIAFLRVYAPTGVLAVCLLASRWGGRGAAGFSPTFLLASYGAITAFAGIRSPDPSWAAYWSIAFLASAAVARLILSARDPAAVTAFLWVTWVAALIVTIGIIHAGGDAVWAGGGESYGINSRIDILSTGVSRWGAVCSLISLAICIHTRSLLLRLALLLVTVTGFVMVYTMQSRGSIFSSVAGVLFLLLIERRSRRWAVPLLIIIALGVFAYRNEVVRNVMTYLERGGGESGLKTMTGRTEIWEEGMQAFREAPLLGRGQWTDRLLGIGHAHNTAIEALLNGGIVGFIPYMLSWVAGWLLFFRLWKRRRFLSQLDRISLLQCGAVLAFFSVRAIPETTTAGYSPDLLMMLAVYAFMERTAVRVRVPALIGYVLVFRRSPTELSVTA